MNTKIKYPESIRREYDPKIFFNGSEENLKSFPSSYMIENNFIEESVFNRTPDIQDIVNAEESAFKINKMFINFLYNYAILYGTEVQNDKNRFHCIHQDHNIDEYEEQKKFIHAYVDKKIDQYFNNNGIDTNKDYCKRTTSILVNKLKGCKGQRLHSDLPCLKNGKYLILFIESFILFFITQIEKLQINVLSV